MLKTNFEEVLEKYADMVFRLAFSRTRNTDDANDVLQEVFLKYVRYVRGGREFSDEEHKKAWLIRTAINTSKTLALSAWNRHRSSSELPETEGEYDKNLTELETKSAVYKAVMELPPKYHTVVHLFYYEDMPVSKISKVTGQSENTVKSQLHRARNLLKGKLEGVVFDV